jgi:hypothetical protein
LSKHKQLTASGEAFQQLAEAGFSGYNSWQLMYRRPAAGSCDNLNYQLAIFRLQNLTNAFKPMVSWHFFQKISSYKHLVAVLAIDFN